MKKADFTARVLKLLEEQLDLYAAKSSGGLFLSDEEVTNVKTIVEAFAKIKTLKEDADGKSAKRPKIPPAVNTEHLKSLALHGEDN